MVRLIGILFFCSSTFSVYAQPDSISIGYTISDLYKVISGPAGKRDWDKFRSLFHQEAMMGRRVADKNGNQVFEYFDPEEYISNNDPFFTNNAFYENEIGRIVNQFGGVAQVFTTYQFRLQKAGPIARRGINSIQLVKVNGQWLITQLIWQQENEQLPIPEKYINKN